MFRMLILCNKSMEQILKATDMSPMMMFTHMSYTLKEKEEKESLLYCVDCFCITIPKYFCRFGSSFRGHIGEYSGLDI
jgi:hypothetical protein